MRNAAKPTRPLVALLATVLAVVASACGSATSNAPTASPEGLPDRGVLFFHRYSSYAAWDASLWELDLATGRLARIDARWRIVLSPINAHPNAAGDELTFMGSQTGLADNEWDVFVSRWDGESWGEPVNLTGPNGKRDEDPKFSPDGHTIAYKENGVLATIEDDGSQRRLLTQGQPESSMPYFTRDGSGIIFERAGSIWLHKGGSESVLWASAGTKAYYPIGVSRSRFLFTEVQASHHDRIVWGSYSGRAPVPMFTGSNDCDNSDPYPYEQGQRFVFYVTGCPVVLKGGYNLVIADRATRTVHDVDEINPDANSHDQELGPAWSGTAGFPK
jgi:hypothetical protein